LDWIGKSSEFNSCLPADITSYKAPPCMLSSLSEDEMQLCVSRLRNSVSVESTSKLYTLLDNLSAPRFAHSRLQLPCIAFPITELRRKRGADLETCFTYDVKADGLQDLLITSEDKLIQFSPTRPIQQTFLLVRPWNHESASGSLVDSKLADSEAHSRELRLVVRLGQPFGALLLAQQRGGEYKRVASDRLIVARVKDVASI
ncbi:hypothetical protein CY34DRAFT_38953, partial [Suillus luteus UH-Slu-Lm8-n1]